MPALRVRRSIGRFALLIVVLALLPSSAGAQPAPGTASPFTMEQVRSYPFPTGLAVAQTGARAAWAVNEQGRRNIYVAEAPAWTARRLTSYTEDDGQELTSIAISADGRHVIYIRGGDHSSNWDDAEPVNPLGSPAPVTVQMWTVPFAGGEPTSLGEGENPAISPRSDRVVFERGGQLWSSPLDGSAAPARLFTARGSNGNAQWSPDGTQVAFVSNRGTHAFVGVFRDEKTPITWIAPSTSRDSSPRWSPDGARLAFVRRPGVGGGPDLVLEPRHQPWGIWTAEVATGNARRLWQAPTTLRGSVPTTHGGTNLHWAAGRIVFLSYEDGWPHLYSIAEAGGAPTLLTPGNYMVEHVTLSADRRTLLCSANAGDTAHDIDRRHVLRVPVDRAAPEVITPGAGLEWTPLATGDGAWVVYIAATPQQPPLVHVRPSGGGEARALGRELVPQDFPAGALVTPRPITYTASDGVTVHAQLFESASPSSAKRPAIVYVHGGPPRQMLLGWHYSDYYANAYAMNQYLASRGFVVLSINFRLGIGYGYEFHQPAEAGSRGAAEYRDVKAAGEYLRTLPQVDGSRIGIYGGSYGGYLTALALARDSGLFAAGVDIHGVHDFTSESARGGLREALFSPSTKLEPNDRERAAEIAWQSSPVSSVATWRSPVLLIHADDDRNVRFSQTVDLVRRLEKQGVPFEEIVIVDDTHHWMRHANQLRVNTATAEFFRRTLLQETGPSAPAQ